MRAAGRCVASLALLCLSGAAISEPAKGYRQLGLKGYVVSWNAPRTNRERVLKWSFLPASYAHQSAINCKSMAPINSISKMIGANALQQETQAAFDEWHKYARVSFAHSDDWRSADILIGTQAHPSGIAFANIDHDPQPGSHTATITKALICLNPDVRWKVGFDGDLKSYDLRIILMHEIGHVLGLDHPGPAGQIMSFRYQEKFRSLRDGDIAGIVAIYGPRQIAEQTPKHNAQPK